MLAAMNTNRIVPIFATPRLAETRRFWVDQLGFELSYDHGSYLGVRAGAPGSPELGFMLPDADEPEAFGGHGAWVAIAVADADAECARVRRTGITIRDELADMPWGSRRFTVVDPNGVVLAISHAIPAAPEFAAHAK